MPESERRQRGKATFTEVTQLPSIEAADPFMAETLDECFGELWSRPGLSRRERRFLTLAMLAARGLDPEVEFHVRGAIASGDITPTEMIEIIMHVRQYGGWPAGAVLHRHLRPVCEDLGLEVPEPPADD